MPARSAAAATVSGLPSVCSARTMLSRTAKSTAAPSAKSEPARPQMIGTVALGGEQDPAGDDRERTGDESRHAPARRATQTRSRARRAARRPPSPTSATHPTSSIERVKRICESPGASRPARKNFHASRSHGGRARRASATQKRRRASRARRGSRRCRPGARSGSSRSWRRTPPPTRARGEPGVTRPSRRRPRARLPRPRAWAPRVLRGRCPP